jgi:HEAT repeat protein
MDDLLVRRSVLNGLRLVKEPWAKQILEEIQVEDGQWVVRNAAQQIVEELNSLDPYIPQPLEPLETLPWLVEFAAEQGTGIGEPEQAREMLIKVLRDGSPDQATAALDILRLKGDEKIFPAVFHLLYGEDPEIAESAYHVIWQLAANGAAIPAPVQFGLGY